MRIFKRFWARIRTRFKGPEQRRALEVLSHLLVLLFGGAAGALFHDWYDQALTNEKFVAYVGLMLLSLPPIVLIWLVVRVDSLQSHLDPEMHFYPVSDEYGTEMLFRQSERIVRLAKREILALNSFAEEHILQSDKDRSSRDSYFGALMQMSRTVEYRRIVQVGAGQKLSKIFDKEYRTHFRAMLETRTQRAASHSEIVIPIRLDLVPPKYPSTFVIVDDEYLVWQLNEVADGQGPPDERLRMRAVVVIHDPKRRFIPEFRNTFIKASQQPSSRSVELHELGNDVPPAP